MLENAIGLGIAAVLLATTVWRLGYLRRRDNPAEDDYPYSDLPDWLIPDVFHIDTKARNRQELLRRGRRMIAESLPPHEAAQVRLHVTEMTSARGWPYPYLELHRPPAIIARLEAQIGDLNSSAKLAGAAPLNAQA